MSEEKRLDHVLNRLHQGTSRIIIGEIPISFKENDAPARETINAMITGFICPGLSIKYATDYNYKAHVQISVQEDNQYDGKLLTVNCISDDRNENYWLLHRYLETIQSGETGGWPELNSKSQVYGNDGFYRNRMTWIPNIDIVLSDGSYQRHSTIRFKRCFPVTLGDLSFSFTDAEPVTFNISFLYSNREVIREAAPSAEIIPPLHVAE